MVKMIHKTNQYTKIAVLFFAFFLFSHYAQAQIAFLTAPQSAYRVGDSFTVSLSVDTLGKSINTVSGVIDIPQDKLQIVDVRYGNSIVTLWAEKPSINPANGTISFAGGIPGGYGGSNGPMLTFGLKARRTGSPLTFLKDVKILLNDGLGTEVQNVTLKNLTLTIKGAAPLPKVPEKEISAPPEEVLPPDTVPPEHFTPLISNHPAIEDNKYFVAFFAVDKDSGIARYEVKEESRFIPLFSAEYTEAKSPYILQYQKWPSRVYVRAYDQAGNYVDAYSFKPLAGTLALLLALAGVVTVGLAVYIVTRRVSKITKNKAV